MGTTGWAGFPRTLNLRGPLSGRLSRAPSTHRACEGRGGALGGGGGGGGGPSKGGVSTADAAKGAKSRSATVSLIDGGSETADRTGRWVGSDGRME